MFAVNILSFISLVACGAACFQTPFSGMLPVGFGALSLVLYALAFFRGLWLIDALAVAWLALLVLLLFALGPKEKRRALRAALARRLFAPDTAALALLFAGIAVLARDRYVSFSSDLEYWALDVKALFETGGYAAKGAAAAWNYGAYPPGLELLCWWFTHMQPSAFSEGLLFVGAHIVTLSFAAPLLAGLKKWNPLALLGAPVLLWLLPGVADWYGYYAVNGDMAAALCYGCLLLAATDREAGAPLSRLRFLVLAPALVLLRVSGLLWALLALLFAAVWQGSRRREARRAGLSRPASAWLLPALICTLAVWLSWEYFCALTERTTSLSLSLQGYIIYVLQGNLQAALTGVWPIVSAWGRAILSKPLHGPVAFGLGLSPFAFEALLAVAPLVLWCARRVNGRAALRVFAHLALSSLVFWAVHLLAHLSMFITESSYTVPDYMVMSIARYGAPLFVGTLMLVMNLAVRGMDVSPRPVAETDEPAKKKRRLSGGARAACICAAFVLLTANYPDAYEGLIGYRASREDNLAARTAMLEPVRAAMDEIAALPSRADASLVCVFSTATDEASSRASLFAYESSPLAVYFLGAENADMLAQILESADSFAGHDWVLLDETLEGLFPEGSELAVNQLYPASELTALFQKPVEP